MIGRFVEEEERRLADEQACEVRAHDPAAGERLGELVVVGFAEAEAGEDLLRARLERVVDVPVVVVLGLELTAAGGDLQDRLVADGGAFLRKEAEVRAAFPFDEAFVGLVLAEDDVEEGGLAGPVGADEAEAVRPGDVQRDLREQGAGSVGLGNIGNREHRSGDKGACEGEVKGRLGDLLASPPSGGTWARVTSNGGMMSWVGRPSPWPPFAAARNLSRAC